MVKTEPQGTEARSFLKAELTKQAIQDKNGLKLFRNY